MLPAKYFCDIRFKPFTYIIAIYMYIHMHISTYTNAKRTAWHLPFLEGQYCMSRKDSLRISTIAITTCEVIITLPIFIATEIILHVSWVACEKESSIRGVRK